MIDHAPKDSSEQEEMKMSRFFFYKQKVYSIYCRPGTSIMLRPLPKAILPKGEKRNQSTAFLLVFFFAL
jgi:hypothetical protein